MSTDMELLAERYLKNKCTPEEAKSVLEWFATGPGKAYLSNQLNKDTHLLENDTRFISPVNLPGADMFETILNRIEATEDTPAAKEPARVIEPVLKVVPAQTAGLRRWYKIAVIAAGVSIGALMAYSYLSGNTTTRSTRFGETARIVLPDSSSVTLNGNSSIEYARDWKPGETRKVKLEGEAFFAVQHIVNKQPFIVSIADTIQIAVLGTEFNVSDRKRHTQVVLLSGKIRLDMQRPSQRDATIIMKPGESVEISSQNSLLRRQNVDPSVVTSWTGNKLIFENTSVRDICERLKDTYGYQISVSDEQMLNQRISGSVPNQNIDMVLEGLEAIMNVKFKKTITDN